MKTPKPIIFFTVTASLHYNGRLSLATLLIYPPRIALLPPLGQRRVFFLPSLRPRVLGSWDLHPSLS